MLNMHIRLLLLFKWIACVYVFLYLLHTEHEDSQLYVCVCVCPTLIRNKWGFTVNNVYFFA